MSKNVSQHLRVKTCQKTEKAKNTRVCVSERVKKCQNVAKSVKKHPKISFRTHLRPEKVVQNLADQDETCQKWFKRVKKYQKICEMQENLRFLGSVKTCQTVSKKVACQKKMTPCQLSCFCLLYTSPSPRDGLLSRMPSSA